MTHPSRPDRGFTLIEVVIVTMIIGILAAVAVPAYSKYVTKTRRTDATVFLVEAAGEQVRFRAENNRYTDDLTELGYPAATVRTPEGDYDVRVEPDSVPASGTRFELVAVPVAGGRQANDAECASLSITSTGARTPAACW